MGGAGKPLVESGALFAAQTLVQRTAHRPAAYDWMEIVFFRDGQAQVRHRSEQIADRVRPGDALVLMPGVPCVVVPTGRVRFTRMFVSAKYMLDCIRQRHLPYGAGDEIARMLADYEFPVDSQVIRVDSPLERDQIRECLDTLVAMTVGQKIRADWYRAAAAATGVMSVLIPRLERGRPGRVAIPDAVMLTRRASMACTSVLNPVHPQIVGARRIMEEHCSTGMTMTEVAQLVCISRSWFQEVFVKDTGKTPLAYRDGLRVRRMLYDLAVTGDLVAQIARRAGWHDPDRATCVFREAVGLSPSGYRELCQGLS